LSGVHVFLMLLRYIGVKHYFHIRRCSCRLTGTRWCQSNFRYKLIE